MVNKNRLPKFPDDYLKEKADDYENSKWMGRNQKRSTLLCIKYLFDENLRDLKQKNISMEDSPLVLDLGCGTGFSSEILIDHGFKVVGIDILPDMLMKAQEKKQKLNHLRKLELILADINNLPIKPKKVNHIISISSYNFIIYGLENKGEQVKLLNDTAKFLNKILKNKGRIIIEFYPKNDKELKMFGKSFINNGFEGYSIKNNPNQKSGQTFLLLKKNMKGSISESEKI
ncbi:MAG: class I SAM-dependent methyltransferase [Candidatus Thorarchaeota archaeon]